MPLVRRLVVQFVPRVLEPCARWNQLPPFSTASARPGSKRSSKRDLIVNVFLRQEGHLTADDLFDLIRARIQRISRATVYRTLQWMVDAGIARKVDFGEGRFRFEHSYRHPRHFHLICKTCNRSFEFLSSDIEALLEEVAAARNFTRAAERAADSRHVRSVPDRPARRWPKAAATELLFARDALRIAIATERSGLEFYSRAARHHQGRARPPRVREARRGGEGAPGHARGALPRAAAAGSAARVAADVPVFQGRRQRPVRRRRRAAGQRRRRSRRR